MKAYYTELHNSLDLSQSILNSYPLAEPVIRHRWTSSEAVNTGFTLISRTHPNRVLDFPRYRGHLRLIIWTAPETHAGSRMTSTSGSS